MDTVKLQARVELLNAEMDKANQNVALLKEQLEKSEKHVVMLMGHRNEANYLYSEALANNPAVLVESVNLSDAIDPEPVVADNSECAEPVSE